MRMKGRFGIRVHVKDEEQAFKALRPGVPFISTDIQCIYSIFRNAICELLATWNWPAKVLQPGRSSKEAMSWTAPPTAVLHSFGQDILVTEVKKLNHTPDHASLTASRKTQQHIRKEPATRGNLPLGPLPAPISSFKKQLEQLQHSSSSSGTTTTTGAASKQDKRVNTLETHVAEIKSQNVKFGKWFEEVKQQATATDTRLNQFQSALAQQQGVTTCVPTRNSFPTLCCPLWATFAPSSATSSGLASASWSRFWRSGTRPRIDWAKGELDSDHPAPPLAR